MKEEHQHLENMWVCKMSYLEHDMLCSLHFCELFLSIKAADLHSDTLYRKAFSRSAEGPGFQVQILT